MRRFTRPDTSNTEGESVTSNTEGAELVPDETAMDWTKLYDFAGALTALKRGYSVARLDWKIPGKYVFLWAGEEMFDPELGRKVPIDPFLMWKNAHDKFVPWFPSAEAVLAEDWFIGKSGTFVPENEAEA